MRRATFLTSMIVSILLLAIAGCKEDTSSPYGTNPNPAPPAANTVIMSGMSFVPATMTVPIGTTVTWQNNDGYLHTSTSDSAGVFDTGNIAGGGSKSATFATRGTFRYHCTFHRAMGMTGTLIVQ